MVGHGRCGFGEGLIMNRKGFMVFLFLDNWPAVTDGECKSGELHLASIRVEV